MILVMDNGRIMASGTHDELLATCDEYRSIYESQTKNQAQPENWPLPNRLLSHLPRSRPNRDGDSDHAHGDTSAADANAADTRKETR